MLSSPRAAATLIACASLLGCVSEGRQPADVVDGDVPASLRCERDDDCDKFANLCNASACVGNVCRSEPIVCDDENVCTSDSCDVTRGGCVFEPRDADEPCVVGRSAACEGDTWHEPDLCDDSGHCVDGGTRACGGLVASTCHHGTCDAGCVVVEDEDGSSCTRDGRSDVCVEGTRYPPDTCRAGVCTDGGEVACPVGFCEAPTCDGRRCDELSLGVDVDITGTWMLFELGEVGQVLESRQVRAVVGGDGTLTILRQRGPLRSVAFIAGDYCVQTDGTMQLALSAGGDAVREYRGRVARGRELAIMHRADGTDGVLVMVKDDRGSANRKLSGGYRLLGVESQRVDGDDDIETMLGTIAIGNDCITGGNYILARGENGYAIEPSLAGECAVGSMDDATLALPVTSNGDPRNWSGVVGPGGDFAVFQRETTDGHLAASLIVLVRYGLAQPFALSGTYDTTRLDVDGTFGKLIDGSVGFDGSGAVTSFAEGDLVMSAGDSGEVEVSTSQGALGAFFLAVTIGGEGHWRVGQIGQSVSSRVDWFVDVQGASFGGPSGPIDAGGLRFGVRRP